MMAYRILSTVVVILGTTTTLAQSNGSTRPKLKVVVSSDKSIYKVGEPILITITLRNEGSVPVWVSKPRGIGIYSGEFYVDVVSPDGTLLRNTSPVRR